MVWFAFGHHCSGLPTAGLRAPKHLQVLVSLLRLSGEAGGGHGDTGQGSSSLVGGGGSPGVAVFSCGAAPVTLPPSALCPQAL